MQVWFASHGHCTNLVFDAVVMPRVGMFEVGMPATSPSQTDVALSQIRSGPRPAAKSDLTFATVESNVSMT